MRDARPLVTCPPLPAPKAPSPPRPTGAKPHHSSHHHSPNATMARRIVRTFLQLVILSGVLGIFVFLLDTRYRVLPHSIHSWLPDHHHAGTVVVDIQLTTCSQLSPLSSCQLDSTQGWYRIEKDVFLDTSWFKHGFLHVKRVKETELNTERGDRIIVDVKVGRLRPGDDDGPEGENAEWEQRTGGIWVKMMKKGMHTEHAVTAIDVLFGPDAVEVREGWMLREGTLNVGDSPRLTVRRGPHLEVKKPVVRMRKDHKLKIIQVSDLHLSTGVGACRHAEPPNTAANCEADPRTLDFIARILDDEKPDIAVLTGDQVNGQTAKDVQTTVFKFAEPFIKRKIPYATILGNHDDEGNLPRDAIMELTASLPYSLSEVGPRMGPLIKDKKGREQYEGGAGNYVIEVKAHGHSDHSAVTIYMVDTHSRSPGPEKKEYDWIKDYQVKWFNETFARLKPDHEKYTLVHLDLAFIHIPLPEYRTQEKLIVGQWKEPPTAPWRNSGFKAAIQAAGIGVVSAGHDHANDYCLYDGMWMCYAGGSGFGGYGGYGGYHRRVRIFEVDAQAGRVRTWKRLEYGDQGPFDEQTVVQDGRPLAPA